ncbi:MAG TPA: PQQ-binding-like beta-propeller repeat protein, partial [Bryobacteraceae bacterium]|nr:PQQ-binding-like beta-propeller repeat protein [Bryobacteraceae bacterium]
MQRLGRTKLPQHCAAWLIVLTGMPGPANGADFPQWRGPNRDGVITGVEVKNWPEKLSKKWSVKVGEGHSSPVLVADRVYQHARLNDREVVSAFDVASGKKLWEHSYAAPYEMNGAAVAHGKGPKSTPSVAAGKLYTFGINGALYCTDTATGKVVWKLETNKAPDFGTALSPAVDSGILYAHLGTKDNGAVTAFDAGTGKQKWRWSGDGPAYASPIVATLGGVKQVLTQSQNHVLGLDAATGQELWKVPFKTDYDQNSVTPVVTGGLIIYSGIGQPVVAIKPSKGEKGWTAAKVWENREISLYMNTPVLSSGLLWGLSSRNKGQFYGLDPQSGKTIWTGEGRQAENAAI